METKKLIEYQHLVDESIKKLVGKYSFDAPKIIVDPYGINPLSAYIIFSTKEKVSVSVKVKGKSSSGDITLYFPNEINHVLPVIGLYDGYKNTVEISLYQNESKRFNIEIDKIDYLDGIVIDSEIDPILMNDCFMIYSSPVAMFDYKYPIGIDSCGDVRWFLNKTINFEIKKSNNGLLISSDGNIVKHPYHSTGLIEYDWMGKIHKFYDVDTLVHHDFIELDDKILVLTNEKDFSTEEDILVVFDRESGKIEKRIDLKVLLDMSKCRKSGSYSACDWFHNNSIFYDKVSNSLIISGRHVDCIMSVDYDSLSINWMLSDPKGWDKEYVDKYFLKPKGYNFEYTYGQHSARINEDGNLVCFDNHYKGKKSDEYVPAHNAYSRGVAFKINTADRSIEIKWQYGKDLGSEFYSPYISFVNYYNDKHKIIHSGGMGFEDGVVSNYHGPKAFERGVDMESKTVEIFNDRRILYIHIKGNYFRASKIDYQMRDYVYSENKAKVVKVG